MLLSQTSRRLVLATCMCIAVSTGTAAIAAAATDNVSTQSITMSPSSTELSVVPGGTSTGSFSVVNEGNTSYRITIYAAPYHVEGIDYDPQFTPLPGTTDASQWVHFTAATSQDLAAHTSQSLSYTLSVPLKTAPGGYYATIFAETTPANA